MLHSNPDHWKLVQSGEVLGKFQSIREAARLVKQLHPNCEFESTHITDQIYELKVQTNAGLYFYTALWSLD